MLINSGELAGGRRPPQVCRGQCAVGFNKFPLHCGFQLWACPFHTEEQRHSRSRGPGLAGACVTEGVSTQSPPMAGRGLLQGRRTGFLLGCRSPHLPGCGFRTQLHRGFCCSPASAEPENCGKPRMRNPDRNSETQNQP